MRPLNVTLPLLLHVSVNDDQAEGDEEIEEKPDINHLQIGSLWKAVIDLNFQRKAYKTRDEMRVSNE